jgi:hypothetical protein
MSSPFNFRYSLYFDGYALSDLTQRSARKSMKSFANFCEQRYEGMAFAFVRFGRVQVSCVPN